MSVVEYERIKNNNRIRKEIEGVIEVQVFNENGLLVKRVKSKNTDVILSTLSIHNLKRGSSNPIIFVITEPLEQLSFNNEILKNLKGVNKDNVYKVAFRKDIISGAGKDKRGSIYHLDSGNGDFFQGKFMIFATALSPDLKKVAFVMDENNDISVYDLQNKNKLATLHGQKGSMSVLIFKDEDTLFSAGDDDEVNIWNLKEKK